MANTPTLVTFALVLFIVASEAAQHKPSSDLFISSGSSLSPLNNSAWYSQSGRFAFGFYPEGNGFLIGIWLVGSNGNITVWTANRDDPPLPSDSVLEFKEGHLFLQTKGSASTIVLRNIIPASSASMHNAGNFVLYDYDNNSVWESFDFPTDTILGGQNLSAGSELLSTFSKTNHSNGRAVLRMQEDGNLVLYPTIFATSNDAYWSSDTYGTGTKNHLFLNKTAGLLQVMSNSSTVYRKYGSSSITPYNDSVVYRAILDADGNFQLYSHVFDVTGAYTTTVMWKALDSICSSKSYCGFNSYCTYIDDQTSCLCLPGTDYIDINQNFEGCERNFTKELCQNGGLENSNLYAMITMDKMELDDKAYYETSVDGQEQCNNLCLNDCDCDAAMFLPRKCKKFKFPVRYILRDITTKETGNYERPSTAFKTGNTSIKSQIDQLNRVPTSTRKVKKVTSKKTWILILILSLSLVTYSCISLVFSGFLFFKTRVITYKTLLQSTNLGLPEEFALRSFPYKELAKATNGFKVKLGRGSFGTVYRGSLYKGKKVVAVKRLEKVFVEEGEREKVLEEGKKEFQAEMLVIGRTHHKNLVRLLGYCSEGENRLLVYEYMSNGTLADLLFRSESRPDWSERVSIALDIARGMLYLHEECEAPIIHCDIKPQNILMDDFWTAKISDFGLAKLLMPDQTRTITGARGTRGYEAPEWRRNIPISVKVDIYSFGIMLLEIVCCRRNLHVQDLSKPEEIVLSTWAYKCLVSGESYKLVGGEEVDRSALERIVKVGLWCIQDEPALRPSMKSVVLILEGVTDIAIPPPPTTS